MAETPVSPATPAPSEADKRHREQVQKRLAQTAATHHARITLGGKALDYQVHAAFVPVVASGFDGARGEPDAAVFTTAYQLKGAPAAQRPLCFAFNGGPGSASIWLQFGALGPKHVVMQEDGTQPLAPYRVSDNPA
ncbi:MAG: S10 family peptidase, partial [Rubrivivax sp.]